MVCLCSRTQSAPEIFPVVPNPVQNLHTSANSFSPLPTLQKETQLSCQSVISDIKQLEVNQKLIAERT
jgi:hypothetical protein